MYKKNIAIVGGMRNVNSKVGRLIAEELGMKMLSVEDAIEYVNNTDIPSILRDFDAEYYYELEERIVPRVMACNNTVIATTGSMALSPDVLEEMSRECYIVLLTAKEGIVIRRIANDERCYPKDDLLDKKNILLRNLAVKLPDIADVTVDTSVIGPNDVKDIVVRELTRIINEDN